MKKRVQKTTLEDWQSVLNTMNRYRRSEGYVKFVGKNLTFFDSNPGHALSITKKEVEKIIKDYGLPEN